MNVDSASLHCLRLILKEDKKALAYYLSDGFDFQAFLVFCEKNYLSGYAYIVLKSLQALELFPKDFVQVMETRYMEQWAINEQLATEMEKVIGFFVYAGIDVICLKGPVMAERFYGHISSRKTRDIDILVCPADIERAEALLFAKGFKRLSRVFLTKKMTIRFTHHFEYEKSRLKIELHWTLARHFSFRIDYEKLWKEKNVFQFREKEYRTLTNEEELVMQFFSIFTDIPLGTIILKQFVDVYQILTKLNYDTGQWEKFLENRKNEGLMDISLNLFDLVLDFFNAKEDFPALTEVLRRYESRLQLKSRVAKMKLLQRAGSLFSKLWAFKLYDAPVIKSIGWWGLSLPFRLCAYPGWISRLSDKFRLA